MNLLTRAELTAFHNDKVKMLEHKETLRGLCDYREQLKNTVGYDDMIKRLDEDIAGLEADIQNMNDSLESKGNMVKRTIETVKDSTAKVLLLMHYYDAMTWDAVGHIMHMSDKNARECGYRNLKRAGIV